MLDGVAGLGRALGRDPEQILDVFQIVGSESDRVEVARHSGDHTRGRGLACRSRSRLAQRR
jgi:hypothetical protein